MAYFTKEKVEFFTSGCALLDCALGGGWPEARMINIQGSSASGKSLLALEAVANFKQKYPDGKVWFIDAESAFDLDYIESLGIPISDINFLENIYTVEDYYNNLCVIKGTIPDNSHGLVILDSLDSLSDEAEKERLIDEATFGATKPRRMSEILRRINAEISHKNVTNIIISQLRDKLNSPYPMQVASGGKALRFYCSQVVKLRSEDKVERTIKGLKRAIGLNINAYVDKNKVGMAYRDADVRIIFGYGMDDLISNLEWLGSKGVDTFGGIEKISPLPDGTKATDLKKFHAKVMELPAEDRKSVRLEVGEIVKSVWNEVEAGLMMKEKGSDVRVTKY